MANFLFYTLTVLIWGSTWLGIKFQLGVVDPALSVSYRFALAALILFAWCFARRLPLKFSRGEHLFIAMQGVFLFAVNYLFFYLAELQITSGLAAVVFSTIVVMNLINGRLFLGTPIEVKVLVGGALGMVGLVLLFWPDMAATDFSGPIFVGMLLSFAATYLASLGNILSVRNQRHKLPIIQTNAFGMAYGSACMALIVLVRGTSITIEMTAP